MNERRKKIYLIPLKIIFLNPRRSTIWGILLGSCLLCHGAVTPPPGGGVTLDQDGRLPAPPVVLPPGVPQVGSMCSLWVGRLQYLFLLYLFVGMYRISGRKPNIKLKPDIRTNVQH